MHDPKTVMLAHQFLYYVESAPVWSDYDYDMFCRSHGLTGGGGSDRAADYAAEVRALAHKIRVHPGLYPAVYDLAKAMAYEPPDT